MSQIDNIREVTVFQMSPFIRRPPRLVRRVGSLILFLCALATVPATTAHAQQAAGVPDSVLANMEQSVGLWLAGNSEYQSDDELFDHYALEWEWGVGQKSLVGRLYGLTDGEESGTFWDFRQFWHPGKNAVIVQQFGWNGTFGTGLVEWIEPGVSELIQTFYTPDGSSRRERHLTHETATVHDGGSFSWVDGEWEARRSYVWHKQE